MGHPRMLLETKACATSGFAFFASPSKRTKLRLRLRLCLDAQLRVQVQGLAGSNVHFPIKLRASRCADLDVVAARPEIHGFQFSDRAGVCAIDVHLGIFNFGIELQCSTRGTIPVITVWIIRSPIRGVPPPESRPDEDATRMCVTRKRRHHHRSHCANHYYLLHYNSPRQLDAQVHGSIVKKSKGDEPWRGCGIPPFDKRRVGIRRGINLDRLGYGHKDRAGFLISSPRSSFSDER